MLDTDMVTVYCKIPVPSINIYFKVLKFTIHSVARYLHLYTRRECFFIIHTKRVAAVCTLFLPQLQSQSNDDEDHTTYHVSTSMASTHVWCYACPSLEETLCADCTPNMPRLYHLYAAAPTTSTTATQCSHLWLKNPEF